MMHHSFQSLVVKVKVEPFVNLQANILGWKENSNYRQVGEEKRR